MTEDWETIAEGFTATASAHREADIAAAVEALATAEAADTISEEALAEATRPSQDPTHAIRAAQYAMEAAQAQHLQGRDNHLESIAPVSLPIA